MEQHNISIPTKQGVPQGSILGPILFIIYTNDLLPNITSDGACCYADDISFLIRGTSMESIQVRAQHTLEETAQWFECNKLKLNESKTQQITFTTKSYSQQESVKFLGLYMDNKLNWNVHISELASRLPSSIFCIRRLKKCCTHQSAKLTYFAYFHSLISYGIIFWGLSSGASRIFVMQKRAIRALCMLNFRESCRESFKTERILTLPCIYILTCLKYVYLNQNKFVRIYEKHQHDTRQKENLETAYHRLKVTQLYADYWGPKLYNKLPSDIKTLNFRKFVFEVKEILIKNCFYSIEEYLSYDFNNTESL